MKEETMGKIVVHEFISLDGVIENPAFTFDYPFVPEMGEAIAQAMAPCKAILLGRKTFEMFAPAWAPRTAAEDPGAPFMNDSPKYVVSSTLQDGNIWKNSEIIGGYDPDKIRAIKDGVNGGIYVSGSGSLVRALLADGLVDELHLFQYPVVIGKGARLFAESDEPRKFTLARSEAFTNGVVLTVYKTS
jgi:dihydrofolate reductase